MLVWNQLQKIWGQILHTAAQHQPYSLKCCAVLAGLAGKSAMPSGYTSC